MPRMRGKHASAAMRQSAMGDVAARGPRYASGIAMAPNKASRSLHVDGPSPRKSSARTSVEERQFRTLFGGERDFAHWHVDAADRDRLADLAIDRVGLLARGRRLCRLLSGDPCRAVRRRGSRPLGSAEGREDQPGISLLQATVLFALTVSGHINIGLLVALTAFQGFVVAFNQPARLALVPSLVPEADLASAVAINSVIFNLARFIGPMFAGLGDRVVGRAAAFAANAHQLCPVSAGARAHSRCAGGNCIRRAAQLRADLKEGIRYTATHPGIASLLVLLIAIGIGGRPLNELLPGFAADVFQAGAGGLCDHWPRRSAAAPSLAASGLAIARIRPASSDCARHSLSAALAAIAASRPTSLWARAAGASGVWILRCRRRESRSRP